MLTGPPEKGDLWSRTYRTRVPFERLLTDQGPGAVFSHVTHTHTHAHCFLHRGAGRVTWPVCNYAQCNMLSMIVLFLRLFLNDCRFLIILPVFLIIVKFLPAFDPGSLSVRLLKMSQFRCLNRSVSCSNLGDWRLFFRGSYLRSLFTPFIGFCSQVSCS